MNQIVSFELYPDQSVLYVYDAALNFSNLNHAAAHILTQGFSGHPRSYKFFTLGDCLNLKVEVWCPDITCPQQEIVLRSDTVRAIMVPFSLSNSRSRIAISHMLGMVELHLWLGSSEEYALVFEVKLRDDAAYLNSSKYQEYTDGGFTEECCRLTFYPREEPMQPEILRTDTWESLPTFNRYTPVTSTHPLLLDDQPTEPLPW